MRTQYHPKKKERRGGEEKPKKKNVPHHHQNSALLSDECVWKTEKWIKKRSGQRMHTHDPRERHVS